ERPDLELAPAQRAEYLRIAREQAERQARLVGDLLELARLDRGAVVLAARPTALEPAARRAAGDVPPETGRSVRIEVPGDLVARADPDRLLQVLVNLIANAVRHGAGD